MSAEINQKILACLGQVEVPYLSNVFAADIAMLDDTSEQVKICLEFGVPDEKLLDELIHSARQVLTAAGISGVSVEGRFKAPSIVPINGLNAVPGVKNIVAVASGKGGVGKSTTAVNIALALASAGARVAMLDADIYGPSLPHMLGAAGERPIANSANMMQPIDALGIQLVSMGNLVTESTPMVWRGPVVSGALQQLLQNTQWENVDYLVVDMPPGTGDIQLTLSQSVPVSGAVIVTTPQDIALLDAKKGIEMFRKVNIPVMGIVENMSTHTCSKCGHKEAVFGERGGDALADSYATTVLGRLPLALSIREQTDAGKPPVAAEPESDIALEYHHIAMQLAAIIWQQSKQAQSAPLITITED